MIGWHKGVLHVHSTYSDGELTLIELRQRFLAAGCAFACITDHAESFDEGKLAAYVAECRSLSDHQFRFLAGLEYDCQNRMHILGYGVTVLLGTRDPQEVIGEIHRHGGLAVIAHPKDAHFPWIETFDALPNGIETWNSKYDGRYAPRPQTFALLRRLQERRPDMRAFYGQDLHWRRQFGGLYTLIRCQEPLHDLFLAALAGGDYVGVKGDLELPSTGHLPEPVLAHFATLHRRSDSVRQVLKKMKKVLDGFGATVPAPVKNQLRRLF